MDERSRKIEEIITRRGIKSLYHFSICDNAESIIEHGILPRDELDNQKIHYVYNDKGRYDYRKDCTCLSITNHYRKLLQKFIYDRNRSKEFYIFEIDPKILIEGEISFFYYKNAACKEFRNMADNDLMKPERFDSLFPHKDDRTNIPQEVDAEILFRGNIAIDHIKNYETYSMPKKYIL